VPGLDVVDVLVRDMGARSWMVLRHTARHNNTAIFHVFELDPSKCEIDLCDHKIYIVQFLDIYFLKIL